MRVLVRDLTGGQSLEIWKGTECGELRWLPNGSQLLVLAMTGVGLVSRFGGASRLITRLGAYIAPPDGSQFAHSMPNIVGFSVSSLDGTKTWPVQLQGFRWLLGLDWNPVTNRISLLSIDDSGTYIVWSVTPDGKDVRRLYSDALPISAMCSSPTAGVLYCSGSEAPRRARETAALGAQEKSPRSSQAAFRWFPDRLQCLRRR